MTISTYKQCLFLFFYKKGEEKLDGKRDTLSVTYHVRTKKNTQMSTYNFKWKASLQRQLILRQIYNFITYTLFAFNSFSLQKLEYFFSKGEGVDEIVV